MPLLGCRFPGTAGASVILSLFLKDSFASRQFYYESTSVRLAKQMNQPAAPV